MTDLLNPLPDRSESRTVARRAAQAALYRWRSRPQVTDLGTIAGRTEPRRCLGCGGTLSRDEQDTHPACEVPA